MTIFQKIVKAKELPPEWAKQFAEPETNVEIVIREVDEEASGRAAAELDAILDQAAGQAAKRGLTPEKLRELLDD